ncbi:MAG: hypothetical protein IT383_08285 [Deltaproteobacteria bacterium]|nr:hypothetical protein [Deltaproteobacteria bacterium]
MSRLTKSALALAAVLVLSCAACTLVLDTEALIVPCTVDQECDDALGEGYSCEENACLPVDTVDEVAEGEGEGE